MTNDANKITREIESLKYLLEAVEYAWRMNHRHRCNWGIARTEIASLRDQCNLLLSPEYLGDEPQPLTAAQLTEIAQQLDSEGACIGADVYCGELDSARLRVECLRDELNKLNLPKASE